MRASLTVFLVLLASPAAAEEPRVQDRLIAAARTMLGKPYVFGGRDGRPGCRGVKACAPGIDCQSLIFFAFEKVFAKHWTKFSVMPSLSVQRKELGTPVPGLDGVLRAELDPKKLQKGDVLFFMLPNYNLQADAPLLERDGVKYGVWHTALVHDVGGAAPGVIHAKPGAEVVVEPLSALSFDAVMVLRLDGT